METLAVWLSEWVTDRPGQNWRGAGSGCKLLAFLWTEDWKRLRRALGPSSEWIRPPDRHTGGGGRGEGGVKEGRGGCKWWIYKKGGDNGGMGDFYND